MKTLSFAIGLIGFVASATQVVDPPLNEQTLIGVWEALKPVEAPHLWHMEIREKGDSYLVEVAVGRASDGQQTRLRSCVVRKLVFSEVRDGSVTLHFAKTTEDGFDLWITGSGEATQDRGGIDAVFSGKQLESPPPQAKFFGSPEGDHFFFVKGNWMRDLGEASKIAEQVIRQQKPTR